MLNANKVEAPTGVTQEPLDDGSYPSLFYAVIDLGVQKRDPYQGKEKLPCRMIMLTYALLDEFNKDEDGNETEDHRLRSEKMGFFNLSSDQATSTKRYKVLDPKIEHEGRFEDCLGTYVSVSIQKKLNESKGTHYNKVTGVTPMRQKDIDRLPANELKPFFFDLDAPKEESWNRLFEWQQNIILGGLNLDEDIKAKLETWQQAAKDAIQDSSDEGSTDAVASTDVESPY